MARIDLNAVGKRYGQIEVLRDINLAIEDGEFIVLVGPSGCGKSTLLRMIAGLATTSSGEIAFDGARINDYAPRDRDVAMVFQSYALYPHLPVSRNMGFSLELRKASKTERQDRVGHAAEILGLSRLLDRFPRALSGGQRQRVAMGRAIVRDPKVFLFDEPLSNLDAALRVEMRLEIAKLHQRLAATMIYVTHDQVEAMTLADRIVVLNEGVIEQVGSPVDLYLHPANLFVARFIGSPKMNVLAAVPSGNGVAVDDALAVPVDGADALDVKRLGVRPEDIALTDASSAHLKGAVSVVERLGADTMVYVEHPRHGLVVARQNGLPEIDVGQTVNLAFAPGKTHCFDAEGRALRRV